MVGAHLGRSHPGPATGLPQPGPDALPFPPVETLVPWQLLTPNSCGENTAAEQLQSPGTSGHVPGVVLSSWGARPKDMPLEWDKARLHCGTTA